MDALSQVRTRNTGTPQIAPADARQVPNSAGGYTFALDDDKRMHRFLILGSYGGSYYTGEKELTRENTQLVLDWARDPVLGPSLVEQAVTISRAGRAPRQQPAIFALAACARLGTDEVRRAALDALIQVCRTGTTLFTFARYAEQFGGWGRGMRRAVGNWYLSKTDEALAYQVLKYRQRDGWSHRDLLRLAHPKTQRPERRALFEWIVKGGATDTDTADVPVLVHVFTEAQRATADLPWLIRHSELSWEMLPSEALTSPDIWRALLDRGNVPMTALIRQLPRLTNLGLLAPMSAALAQVVAQLTDAERIRKSRLHPINVLVALRTYANGVGRGQTWQPVADVIDALDRAFYSAFGNVTPANKRTLVAIDVSASMSWHNCNGLAITPAEAAGAMALVLRSVEPQSAIMAFSYVLVPVDISPRQRLDDALRKLRQISAGGTDCALPILHALRNKIDVDTFVVLTDNETWAGAIHPHEALRQYRQQINANAKLVVVGMTSTGFSIADPTDLGMLDIAGFDSAVPNLISDFSAGL